MKKLNTKVEMLRRNGPVQLKIQEQEEQEQEEQEQEEQEQVERRQKSVRRSERNCLPVIKYT